MKGTLIQWIGGTLFTIGMLGILITSLLTFPEYWVYVKTVKAEIGIMVLFTIPLYLGRYLLFK